ncbi:MAG: MBOAT family protein [Firmicutes bacterium]|nr:MBOAT family protein [Bacillota bacterium]
MSFASVEFVIFFAALLALWYSFGGRLQRGLLLLANMVFYSSAGLRGLAYMLLTALATYASARAIDGIYGRSDTEIAARKTELSKDERKALKAAAKASAKRVLVLCLVLDIGILAAVKYSRMFIESVPAWLGAPLAVSFYTFMAVAYLVDVYWKRFPAEKDIVRFLTFISFFPQMVQGPISRYGDLSATLFERHGFDAASFRAGLLRALWGYSKKLIIADRLAPLIRTVSGSPAQYRGAYVLILVAAYAVQLYADFTGGIDITIGLSRMLGIRVTENFRRPYFSKSTAEYWRRWHISMGSWFRDYVFYPLYTSKAVSGMSRKLREAGHPAAAQRISMWLCTMLVWALTGLWHGASMNFVVWGLGNGLIIMISQELAPAYKAFHARFGGLSRNTAYKAFCCLRTAFLMSALNALDVYPGSGNALAQLLSVFGAGNWSEAFTAAAGSLGLAPHDWAAVALGTAAMLCFSLAERKRNLFDAAAEKPLLSYAVGTALALAVLVFGAYGIGFDASQFIYNQF